MEATTLSRSPPKTLRMILIRPSQWLSSVSQPEQTGTAELQLVRMKSAEDRMEHLPQRVAIGILESAEPLDD